MTVETKQEIFNRAGLIKIGRDSATKHEPNLSNTRECINQTVFVFNNALRKFRKTF